MLCLYQSPFHCRIRKAEGRFTQKLNYRWHLPSFGMLSSVDVSGQPNGPIFKGQGVEEKSLITGLGLHRRMHRKPEIVNYRYYCHFQAWNLYSYV
jgi:hypothetical protein